VEKIKMKIVNAGLSMISVDQKLVRMILDTFPSNIHPVVILVVTKMIQEKLVTILEKPEKKSIYVTNGKIGGINVSVVRTHIGGPHTAMIIECLKRSGVQTIIRFDFCGSLKEEIPVGAVIAPKSSLLLDGTSKDYLEEYLNQSTIINQISTENNISKCSCSDRLWTQFISLSKDPIIKECSLIVSTDSLFLENQRKIAYWRSLNVETVDMECSVVYLLSALYNIDSIAIMVVTDQPGSENFDMFKNNKIFDGLESSIAKGIDVVKRLVIMQNQKSSK
jgi:uridine phosphorylase